MEFGKGEEREGGREEEDEPCARVSPVTVPGPGWASTTPTKVAAAASTENIPLIPTFKLWLVLYLVERY